MQTIRFESFGQKHTGRVISHDGDLAVVFARNPYGGHNLVVVKLGPWPWQHRAVRHGNHASMAWACSLSERAYRRVMRFCVEKGLRSAAFI